MTTKCQFIIEVDGVPQTERNYQREVDADREIQLFPDFLREKSKVVRYVREN